MSRSERQDLIFGAAAFGVGAVAMLLYARFYSEVMFPYSYDSASYISAARNLLEGKGLLAPTLADADEDLQTIYLWPPGFPLLIYLFSFVLGTPYEAALFISRLSLALVPAAAFWLVRPYCTPGRSLLLSLLFWTPPGLMPGAYYTGADAPFFLFVLVSTATFLKGIDRDEVRFLAAAGAMGGASLVIRNAGLALLAAQAAILVLATLEEPFDLKLVFRRAASWGLAAAIPIGGLLIWNKVQFGTLSPYEMPPSTLGLMENIGAAMSAYAYDSLPSAASRWLAARYVLLSASLFALLVLPLFAGVCLRYRQNKPFGRFALFALLYAVLGTVMVVAARTRYQWGEFISVRHIAQYDSFLIAAALMWLGLFGPFQRRAAVIAAIVLIIVGWRGWFFIQEYRKLNPLPQQSSASFIKDNRNAQTILIYYAQLPQLRDLAKRISPACHLSTNLYTVMASTLGHNAHDLDQEQFFALDRLYMAILNDRAKSRPALIVLGQTPVKHNTGAAWRWDLQDALPDFRLLTFDPASLIVLESARGGCLR